MSGINHVSQNDSLLLEKLRQVLEEPLLRIDMDELGRYNRAYATRYAADRFEKFVITEWYYYRAVLNWYKQHIAVGSTVLEVGTFIPVIPLILSWEGYKVTTIEKLSLYGNCLDEMISLIKKNNVNFIDDDIMSYEFKEQEYDAINLLSVVEHLLGSPKALLIRLNKLLTPRGQPIFVVPNQARLIRRLGLMFGGISVQPDFKDYFESDYPFEGHHREYTMPEMIYALESTDYTIVHKGSIKYPPKGAFLAKIITITANLLGPDLPSMSICGSLSAKLKLLGNELTA